MKKIFVKFLISLFSLIFFLLLLEIALRIGGYFYINKISKGPDIPNSSGASHKILCIGDSYTVGGEVEWKDSYPSQLQQKLSGHSNGAFSVINGGICEANSTQAYWYLSKLIKVYDPDYVILLVGSANRFNLVGYGQYEKGKKDFLSSLRIYKMAKIIIVNLKGKILGWQSRRHGRQEPRSPLNLASDAEGEFIVDGDLDYDEAEERYRKEIELHPNQDAAYIKLGQCYREQKKFKHAEELYKRAIGLNSGRVWAHTELGYCYQEQGKYQEAEQLYKKALKLNPSQDWAYIELGYCYQEQGKYQEAEQLYKKAVELNPNQDRIYTGLGYCYQEQAKFKEAERMYRKAIELNPDQEETYGELAGLYNELGKCAQALEFLLKAIEYRPRKFVNYYFLVRTYELQSRYSSDHILNFFQKISGNNPDLIENGPFKNYVSFFQNRQDWEGKINKWLSFDLERIVDLCRQNNIKIIIQNYPYPYSMANKALEEIALSYSLPFVDNYSVFERLVANDGWGKYFVDYDHCTPEGHRIMAEHLSQVLFE